MATTSIIKRVVIKDRDALKRFVDINNNENPLKLNDVKTGQYEQGKAVVAAGVKQQYDESVKNLLSNTQILAWIIKWTMVEFRDMELEEIIPYIGSPNVSGIAVDPGLTNQKIEGENTESKIKGEGLVTYDVRVYVTNPKSNKKGEVV